MIRYIQFWSQIGRGVSGERPAPLCFLVEHGCDSGFVYLVLRSEQPGSAGAEHLNQHSLVLVWLERPPIRIDGRCNPIAPLT